MGKKLRVCPECSAENNPMSKTCWKCSRSFFEGTFLAKLILFFRSTLGWLSFLFCVGVGLFCWGLASNVIFGKMTTGQYVHQVGKTLGESFGRLSGPILGTLDRITNVEGILNGPFRKYYWNGRIKSEITYKNGKREGPARLYHENGELKTEGFYRGGKLEGPVKEYDEKGVLRG